MLDEIGGALSRFCRIASRDSLSGEVEKLTCFHGRIPNREPDDPLTLWGVNDRVAIAIPSGRAAHSLVLVVQLLGKKKPSLEFPEVVVVDLRRVGECAQRDARRIVALQEECGGMDYLLGGCRHVLV